MNEDLKWLAENVHEWKHNSCDFVRRGNMEEIYCEDPRCSIYPHDVYFTRAQWQAARDELGLNHSVEPAEKVWRGPEDGLPPVGQLCEARIVDEWHEGEIVAHARGYAILMTEHEDTFALNESSDFRPLRTEEDKVIQEMLCIMEGGAGERAARALYRAGYRQQANEVQS